jgi:hypothetical protein
MVRAFGPELAAVQARRIALALAAGDSLTRVMLAGRAARRCPATRATLT